MTCIGAINIALMQVFFVIYNQYPTPDFTTQKLGSIFKW